MNFDEYTSFVKGMTIYPGKQTGSKEALAYTALGLVGEGGEYSEKVKKYLRNGVFDAPLAAKELGDVLFYVTACASELGFGLDAIAQMNVRKLEDRKARGVLKGNGDER